MTWFGIALVAYLGLAVVAVIDKYLLTGPVKSPIFYAGSLGVVSGIALLVLPFAWFVPTADQLMIDFLSGVFFIGGLILYFTALKHSEASRVVPIASAFVPLFTVILARGYLKESLSIAELSGFLTLSIGGIIASLHIEKSKTKKIDAGFTGLAILTLTALASLFFALHAILIKQVFDEQPFIGGLVWMSTGKVVSGLVIIALLTALGRLPGHLEKAARPKSVGLFILGRVLGGASGLIQNYAIYLASVSLVTALQGFQYAFLFILIYLLGKFIPQIRENFSRPVLVQKIGAALLLSVGLFLISLAPSQAPQKNEFGVTFSKTFAIHGLGIDWQKSYDDIINELQPAWIRIPVYWREAEPRADDWELNDIEYMVKAAADKNIKIILALGQKLPRWPECHVPEWAQALDKESYEKRLMNYLRGVVEAYDGMASVRAWQIENEPLLDFGICMEADKKLLGREARLVRQISDKPIIISDSGELSNWVPEAGLADILGTTMYRHVYDKRIGQIFYPFPPDFFRIKAALTKLFSGKSKLQIINVELQGEPWGPEPLDKLPLPEQIKLMNAERLKDNAEYAKKAGFSPILFWGAEWWWWMREVNNNPTLWDTAREIMNN